MGKKQYRPLSGKGSDYQDLFADKEAEQSEYNRNAAASDADLFAPSGGTAPAVSAEDQQIENDKLSQQTYLKNRLADSRAAQMINHGQMGAPDGLSSTPDNTLIFDSPDGPRNDYNTGWNQDWLQLGNQIDVLQAERYKGYQLLFENEIMDIQSKAKAEERELNEDETDHIESLQEEIKEYEEEYVENQKVIMENSKDISKLFDMRTQLGESIEGEFIAGELFKEIGGSASDAESMLAMVATSFAVSQAAAASYAAIAGGVGTVGTPVGSGVAAGLTYLTATIGGTAAGLWWQYNMRKNESASEAYGEYTAKKDRLTAFAVEQNGGMPISEQQEMQIDQQARLGVKTLYDQQNNLFAFDMLNTVIHALPWTRALAWADDAAKIGFKTLSVSGKTANRLTRGSFFMGINAIGEGAEEGDQYQINQDYQANKFSNDDYGYNFLGLKWRGLGDNAVTRGKTLYSMGGMLTGRHVGGQTDTPEFRNSVRSGMMLGGLMGVGYAGITAGSKGLGNITKAKVLEGEYSRISPFFVDYLNAEQSRSRAILYDDIINNGRGSRFRFGKLLRSMQEGGVHAEKLEDAGVDAKKIYQEYQQHKALKSKLDSEFTNLTTEEKRNLLIADAKTKSIIASQLEHQSAANSKLQETITEVQENKSNTLHEGLEKLARVAGLKANIGDLERFEMDSDGNPIYTNHIKANLAAQYNRQLKEAEKELAEYYALDNAVSKEELEGHELNQSLSDLSGRGNVAGNTALIMGMDRAQLFNSANKDKVKTHPLFAEAQYVENQASLARKKQTALAKEWNDSKEDRSEIKDGDTVWAADGSTKGTIKFNEDGSATFSNDHVSLTYTAQEIAEGAIVKRITIAEQKDATNERMNSGSDVGNGSTIEETNDSKIVKQTSSQETNTTEEVVPTKDPSDFLEKPNVRVYNYSTREVLDYQDAQALDAWIHSRTDAEILGTTVKYIIDFDALDFSKLTILQKKAIKEGKPFPKGRFTDVGSLPVKMVLLDSKGNVILSAGVPIGSYLGDTKGKIKKRAGESTQAYESRKLTMINKNKNMVALKSRIYEAHLNGATEILGTIDAVGFGEINQSIGENFGLSALGTPTLGIGIGGAIVDQTGAPLTEGSHTNAGRIYALVKTLNGFLLPVKLNQRNINQEEAEVLWGIVKGLLNSTKKKAFTMGSKMPGHAGLTVGQFLSLLIHEMSVVDGQKHGKNSIFEFILEKAGQPSFRVGESLFTKEKIDAAQTEAKTAFMKAVLTHKKRTVHKAAINGSIFSLPTIKNLTEFTFFGQTYIKGKNDSYTNFLSNNGNKDGATHVVSTDAALTKHNDIVRNRELGLSINIGTDVREVTTPVVPESLTAVEKIIAKLIKTKEMFKLATDGSGYVNILTKQIYSRVTAFIGTPDKVLKMSNDIDSNNGYEIQWNAKTKEHEITISKEMIEKHKPSNAQLNQLLFLKTSTIIGNNVDMLVRDYFNSGIKTYSEYVAEGSKTQPFLMHDSRSFDSFILSLDKLSEKFAANGETVISNPAMDDFEVVLHNDDLGIAGTVDLMTVDSSGKVRIYDMKTIRNIRSIDQEYQGSPSKRSKWGKQLSLYRILLNNTYGILAEDIKVIAINVAYERGNPRFTPTLELSFIGLPMSDKINGAIIKPAGEEKTTPDHTKDPEVPLPEDEKDTSKGVNEESDVIIIPTGATKPKPKKGKYNRDRKGKYGGKKAPMKVDPKNTKEELMDTQKAAAYIQKIFGGAVPVEIVDGLIALGEKGAFAYGIFTQAMVVLSNQAISGTQYHEAWHALEELYLSPKEILRLNEETSNRHGEPTDQQIDSVVKKWKSAYNEVISTTEARRIILSEFRAEDYRGFELANETFIGRVGNFFRTVRELIKNIFTAKNSLETQKIFSRLSRGYYAKQEPIAAHVRKWSGTQQVLPMEVPGLSQEEISGVLGSMMGFILETGNPIDVIDSLQDLEFDSEHFVEVLSDELQEAKEAGDFNRVEKLTLVIGNMGEFNKSFENYMASMSIYSDIVSQQSLEDQSEDIEANEEGRGLDALKMHFETSGKDNATSSTKILLSFIPKFDVDGNIMTDPITGMDQMESPTYIWNTVETHLSGIVGYTNEQGHFVSAQEQMMERLDYLASVNRSFAVLKDRLLQLTPSQQSQFFNAMSKANMEFITTRFGQVIESFAGQTSKYMKYKYFNPHQRGKANRIFESWVEAYSKSKLFKKVKGQVVPDIEAHKEAFNVWIKQIAPKKVSDVYDSDLNSITQEGINDVKKLLALFGVEVSDSAVYQVLHEINPLDEQAAYITLKNKYLKSLFSSTGRGGGKRFNIHSIAKNNGIVDGNSVFIKSTDTSLNKNNTLHGERSVFMMFASAEAMFETDYGSSTVRGPEGKMFWVYSLNNYLKKAASQIKASPWEIQNRRDTLFGRSSRWLKELADSKKSREAFTIRVFNELRKEGGQDLGTSFKDLEPADEHLMRLNMLFANIDQLDSRGLFFPPTFADKSVSYIIEGPQLLLDDVTYDPQSATFTFPKAMLNVMGEYLITELKRIRAVERDLFGPNKLPDNKLIANYHYKGSKKNRKGANGLKFMLFPELNSKEGNAKLKELGLLTSKGLVFNTLPKEAHKLVNTIVQDALSTQAAKEMRAAIDNKVITQTPEGTLRAPGMDQKVLNFFRKVAIQKNSDTILTDAIGSMVGNYMFNTMMGNIETMMMFSGDPAYYKSMNDLLKRMPAIIAPGQDLDIQTKDDRWFNVAVSEDVIIQSTEYEKYVKKFIKLLPNKTEKQIREILNPYTEVNTTDAQAYITLERWRFLKTKLGQWKDKRDNASFDRLKRGVATQEDLLMAAQPLKGMYFSLINGVPTYLKYSQAVLIPQAINGTGLERIATLMDKQKIDEHVFISGIKVGALSPTNFNLTDNLFEESFDIIEGEFNVMTLDNNHWKLQQDMSPHTADRQLEGSQVKKNIIANIKQDKSYTISPGVEMSGYDIIKKIHELDRELSDKGKSGILKQLGIQETGGVLYIKDWSKISNILIKQFSKKESTSDELLNSLKVGKDGKLVESLEDNIFRKQIYSMISSMITKATVKLQMLGGSYIQMSAFGMNKVKRFSTLSEDQKSGITLLKSDEQLRPPHIGKDGISRGQILLPHWMKDAIPGADRMTADEITKYVTDKRLMYGIGYRIPNQGMSSIDALEVVGFLPKTMGDTIIAYDEITAKTGSDFDIDKMYVMLPEFKRTAKGIEYVEYLTTTEELYDDKYGKKQRYVEKVIEGGRDYKAFNTTEKAFIKLQEKVSNYPTLVDFQAENQDKTLDQLNSKAAIRNKKLELYAAILLSDNTFVELVSPLDQIGLKNNAAEVRALEAEREGRLTGEQLSAIEAASEKPLTYAEVVNSILDNSMTNLEWLSPHYQLFIKETFNGGKTGVGQQARHLVDHAISQWNYLNNPTSYGITYLGVGNRTKLFGKEIDGNVVFTDLGAIYDTEGNLISDTISGRLDAYVDIAKDPYIFYLNNNSITSNTVALLDRAGVDPEWTNFFMAQPSLKEYVKVKKLDQAKSVDPVFGKNGRITSAADQVRGGLIERIIEFNPDFKAFTKKQIDDIIDKGDIENTALDLETLKEGIYSDTESSLISQLLALELFLAWEPSAMELNKAVSASKADTKGAGKGIISAYKAVKSEEELIEAGNIYGFTSRFYKTMLGKYTENSRDLFLDVFGEGTMFLSESFQQFLFEMKTSQGVNLNEDMLEYIEAEFRSYMYGQSESLSFENLEEQLFGAKTLAKKLQYFKLHEDSNVKDNSLISYLSVNTRSDFDFIQSQNTLKKSGFDKNALTNAWRDLLKSEDIKVQEFARDLARFSYVMSGFKNNLFTFHELIPRELKDEMGLTTHLQDRKGILNDSISFNYSQALDYILRHGALNSSLIPSIPESLNKPKNKQIFGILRTPKDKLPILIRTKYQGILANKQEISENPKAAKVYAQYITFNDPTLGIILYKLQGYSENKSAVYSLVERLGVNESGKQLNEYSSQMSMDPIVSILPQNHFGKEAGVVEKLAYEEAQKYVKSELLEDSSEQDDNSDGPMAQLEEGVIGKVRELIKLMELGGSVKFTFNVNLSRKEKDKLRSLGYDQNLIDFLDVETKNSPSRFKGMRLDAIARILYQDYVNQYSDQIKGLELMAKEADTQLDNYLIDFLSKYGVSVIPTTLKNIKDRYGMDAVGLTDALNKIILIAKDEQRRDTMPEEFGHMLVELLGWNSDLVKSLRGEVKNWSGYQAIYDQYKNDPNYQLNGEPHLRKIEKEAIGQLVGRAIVMKWESNKQDTKNWFLQKAIEIYEAVMDMLKNTKSIPAESIANDIANDVLNGNREFLENYSEAAKYDFKPRSLEATLHGEDLTNQIIEIIVGKGGLLTGSLAVRAQGILLRPDHEDLHDLDFKIDPKREAEVGAEKIIENIKTAIDKFSTFEVIYDNLDSNGVVNATITTVPGLSKKFASLRGGFSKRLDQLSQAERDNIILIDLFFGQENVENMVEGNVHWSNVFHAKMSWDLGRSKDAYDFQNFVPFDKSSIATPVMDGPYVLYRTRDNKVIQMAKEALDLGAVSPKSISKISGEYYTVPGQAQAAATFIANTNKRLFGGGNVISLDELLGQGDVNKLDINPSNYRGSNTDLHSDYTKKDCK